MATVAGATEIKGGAELVILDANSLFVVDKEPGLKFNEVQKLPELRRLKATHIWLGKEQGIQDEVFALLTDLKGSALPSDTTPGYSNGKMFIYKELRFEQDEMFKSIEYLAANNLLKEISLGFLRGKYLYLHSVKLRNDLVLTYDMMRLLRFKDDRDQYSVNLVLAGMMFSDTIHREILSSAQRAYDKMIAAGIAKKRADGDVRYELYISQASVEKLQAMATEAELLDALRKDDGVSVEYTSVSITEVDESDSK
jgi:hypothetical protein